MDILNKNGGVASIVTHPGSESRKRWTTEGTYGDLVPTLVIEGLFFVSCCLRDRTTFFTMMPNNKKVLTPIIRRSLRLNPRADIASGEV